MSSSHTLDDTAAGRGPALQVDLLPHGAVLALHAHGVMLNLFPGNLLEGGPANLWLRRLAGDGTLAQAVPLLGPLSPLQPLARPWPTPDVAWCAAGHWQGLQLQLQLRVAPGEVAAWFWHLAAHNTGPAPLTLDLLQVQDVGLSTPDAIRLNEYYVSHYVDLQPLPHAVHGMLLAARQNQPVAGRHPWLLMGSLRGAVSFATDALQLQGLGSRAGGLPQGVQQGLPGTRLQHEHALLALQDAAVTLAPGQALAAGCWGLALAHHPAASSAADTAWADVALALPQAQPAWPAVAPAPAPAPALAPEAAPSLLATAPWLATADLTPAEVDRWLGSDRLQAEQGADGGLLSFFRPDGRHVVLRAKELAVKRPHGHLLRSGQALVPDETALTSTVWMSGGFHSMLTQGHVAINRCLGTVRSWLRLFRSHGQQVLVDAGQGWQQLGLPSAFEMAADRCTWWYRHAGGLLQVQAWADTPTDPRPAAHAMHLQLQVLDGGPLQVRVTHQVCLAGDDGRPAAAPLQLQARGGTVFVPVPAGSALAQRFAHGGFSVGPAPGSTLRAWGDDALLYADGRSRGQHWLCVDGEAAPQFGLRLTVQLVDDVAAPAADPALAVPLALPQPGAGGDTSATRQLAQLNTIQPWLLHNALVHYLAPRGLEQFSGGGWGTRDVCQGPLEMLLALDRPAPVRDLLLRVFSHQNVDGDWPQWFMFYDRERGIRAGDAHGDIVFWPLAGLARYLLASGDAALLDEAVPFFDAPAQPLWQHVERALVLIAGRCVDGTRLVSYGHGDWNDSLQPADPALREHLCSTWTVTLHHQTAQLLQQALAAVGRGAQAAVLQREAERVAADFRRLALPGGVVAGYLLFDPPGAGTPAASSPEPLLHPQDRRTGLRYSLLPLMHAVLENLLTPDEARQQAALIEQHLTGPDGARLFDRPLPYRGGPMTLFQRAESSAFFGREIGVMYMHAHLRWAEMLAHLGQAERFFQALCLAHPVGLPQRLPQAALRQANCYYSSSDAAFVDRWEAQAGYGRIQSGGVALEGGWRVYSSGPGLAIGLWVTRFLGLRRAFDQVVLDPVLPAALGVVRAQVPLAGHTVQLVLRPGPRGCGVQQLWLDGQPLPFLPEANPYRAGGACVALAAIRPLLQAAGGQAELVVQTL